MLKAYLDNTLRRPLITALLAVFSLDSTTRNEELKRQRDRADTNAAAAIAAQHEALTVKNTAVAGQVTAEAFGRAADYQRILAQAQALAFRTKTIEEPETRLLVTIAAAERVPDAQFAGENADMVNALEEAFHMLLGYAARQAPAGKENSAMLASDGPTILTTSESPGLVASGDGTARPFPVYLSDLLTRARSRVTRDLTPE